MKTFTKRFVHEEKIIYENVIGRSDLYYRRGLLVMKNTLKKRPRLTHGNAEFYHRQCIKWFKDFEGELRDRSRFLEKKRDELSWLSVLGTGIDRYNGAIEMINEILGDRVAK